MNEILNADETKALILLAIAQQISETLTGELARVAQVAQTKVANWMWEQVNAEK